MEWPLSFISEEDLTNHVRDTIEKYGEKLESFDIVRFNKNIVDPIKMIFDKSVYQVSWEEIIGNEIFRQRDKANNNDIGYFHQRIFQYMDHCRVPDNGKEGGWDVIFEKDNGISLPEGEDVHTVYVEMKNKHNTMNSASAGKTYIKMQSQLLDDDDCACFLVEAIAKTSQNIKWKTKVDGKNVSHKKIRRVSLDQFYALVTGQDDALYQLGMILPSIIQKVINDSGNEMKVPRDTVVEELKKIADKIGGEDDEVAMAMAIYLLGFNSYNGFSKLTEKITGNADGSIKRIYEYARRIK